eukprot:526787-Pyramimonas_sp.AAC.1
MVFWFRRYIVGAPQPLVVNKTILEINPVLQVVYLPVTLQRDIRPWVVAPRWAIAGAPNSIVTRILLHMRLQVVKRCAL